jgi:serine/threonine protein kinase
MRRYELGPDDDDDDGSDVELSGQVPERDHTVGEFLDATVAQPAPYAEITPRLPTDTGDHRNRPDSSGSGSEPSDPSLTPGIPPFQYQKGQTVFGRYKLLRPLGAGGMGEVWLVTNLEDMERVRALKLIRPEYANNERWWRRFEREARLMVKLEHHKNAVKIYKYGRQPGLGGFIEMDRIKGRSLDKLLKERQGKPMTPEEVAPLLDQLCDLLQEAHGYVNESTDEPTPIIHRDLKPSNLMLVKKEPPDRNLKVLDFGIAKLTGDEEATDPGLTGEHEYVGTIYYSSPEQLHVGQFAGSKAPIDGRSDLYSVGVVLYQLLTGKLPFDGPTYANILVAHASQPPPWMRKANRAAHVPRAIERVVRRCLEKDPKDRPQSAEQLAAEFRAALRRKPIVPVAGALLILALLAALLGPRLGWPVHQTQAGKNEQAREEGDSSRSSRPGIPDQRRKIGENKSEGGSSPRPTVLFPPKGYEAEDADDHSGLGPKVLVRVNTAVRFIQVPGKTYRRGEPKQRNRDRDDDTTPWAHWVKVRGFYLQETEVTNGEIEDYLKEHPQEKNDFTQWQALYDVVKEQDKEGCRKYPAACIDYPTALRFARSVGGRLPTEAEWELAAKDGNDDYCWVWGEKIPPDWRSHAACYDNNHPGASPVGSFNDVNGDRTERGILDLTGNVREWCLDAHRPYKEIVTAEETTLAHPLEDSPMLGPFDPKQKYVVRGGCFLDDEPRDVAVYCRREKDPRDAANYIGFRVVIEIPDQTRTSVATE